MATKPLKVLAFSDMAWPEGSGGVERSLFEIYPRLAESGQADVCLVTLAGKDLPQREARDGIELVRARRIPLERLTGLQVALSLDGWRTGLRVARTFAPDLVHAHTLFYHSSLIAAAVARRSGIPLLLTMHVGAMRAMPQPQRALISVYERSVGRTLLAAARRVICVSDDVRRHAQELGADERKLVVIPNGVDLERYAPRPGQRDPAAPLTVLYVGRLILNKGPQDALAAAEQLLRSGVNLRLVYAGEGPLEVSLRRRAAALGLDDRVAFLGQRDDVEALMAEADVFIRPSLTEGMSLAVLEAMAAGLPIVASDVTGMRQLIDDQVNGLIIPAGSAADLAAALRRLAADAALRARLGTAARLRASAYDWSAVAAATAREMDCARS